MKILLESWNSFLKEETNVSKTNSMFGGLDLDIKSDNGKAKIFVGSGTQLSKLINTVYPKYIDSSKYVKNYKNILAWIDYVESNAESKGSGSKLMDEILSILKQQNVSTIFLQTASGSEQDKRKKFFEKHGFEELSNIDDNRPRRLMIKKSL